MPMTYQDFLDQVIDDGIEAVMIDYKHRKTFWREGAVAGFEACRRLSLVGLERLLYRARRVGLAAFRSRTDIARYWRVRSFESEVEWVCNVVSAWALAHDEHVIVPPTARGVIKMAQVVGVEAIEARP